MIGLGLNRFDSFPVQTNFVNPQFACVVTDSLSQQPFSPCMTRLAARGTMVAYKAEVALPRMLSSLLSSSLLLLLLLSLSLLLSSSLLSSSSLSLSLLLWLLLSLLLLAKKTATVQCREQI
ncbi:unnamed protein product [Polarella glacialis]|uniref:Uncharacterized protein n=1 Tax=Polarella glacialis TaxID=89957 RepID=A0A813FWH3_POLGL|nr:unnamed protein product [Polarella glacialis]